MQFYSGFSLENEEYLFDKYLNRSEYCVAGFSYGAIKAFNHVKKQIASSKRVDVLQLFSPAFFQTKDTKFKRLQILAYSKNKDIYLKKFIYSCFNPHEVKIVKYRNSTLDELEELLNYEWNLKELEELVKHGVKIEVYLGEKDSILDIVDVREFFLQICTLTYIKNANHFLQIN